MRQVTRGAGVSGTCGTARCGERRLTAEVLCASETGWKAVVEDPVAGVTARVSRTMPALPGAIGADDG